MLLISYLCVAIRSQLIRPGSRAEKRLDRTVHTNLVYTVWYKLNAKLAALRTFTLSVVRDRGYVDDSAVQAFLDAGFTKRQILEVILGVSQKVMSNYTKHLANTPVDTAFRKLEWKKAA